MKNKSTGDWADKMAEAIIINQDSCGIHRDVATLLRKAYEMGSKDALAWEIESRSVLTKRKYLNNSEAAKRIRLEFAPGEHCHGGTDGDCYWDKCPQERNRRADYLIRCPLDIDYGERD